MTNVEKDKLANVKICLYKLQYRTTNTMSEKGFLEKKIKVYWILA